MGEPTIRSGEAAAGPAPGARVPSFCQQTGFDVRCEWGERGVDCLAGASDVVVIVDVLSFSTAVQIATERGAVVYPWQWNGVSAASRAKELGAEVAGARGEARFSLSPASMLWVGRGTRLVLPSPNGAALSLLTGRRPTLLGCLRNAAAVARVAVSFGPRIALVPAGERWPDGSLRPAVEDLIGAGAILRHLPGTRSPESQSAVAAFESASRSLRQALGGCASGRELIEQGFFADIDLAAELDVSAGVPVLENGAYTCRTAPGHG